MWENYTQKSDPFIMIQVVIQMMEESETLSIRIMACMHYFTMINPVLSPLAFPASRQKKDDIFLQSDSLQDVKLCLISDPKILFDFR